MNSFIVIPEDKVEKTKAHGEKVLAFAKAIHIETAEDLTSAQNFLLTVTDAKKKVKGFSDLLLKPIKEAVKGAEGVLKPLLVPYETADEVVRREMERYFRVENEKRAKEAEAERQRRAEENKRIMEENARKLEEAKKENKPLEQVEQKELVAPEPVQKPDFSQRTEQGTVSTMKRWSFDEEKVDLAKVPREFLMLDTKKVNEAIKAGERSIPGLVIYEKEVPIVRQRA